MKHGPIVMRRSRTLRAAAYAGAIVCAVAGLGMWATELGAWYAGLRQPTWKPPDAWFGPAWSLIYTLATVAAVRAWLYSQSAAQRRCLLSAFGLNAGLNLLWSVMFFRQRRPDWALAEVVLFWLSILALVLIARRIDAAAAWLLAPYVLWVGFAALLNLAVVRLNAPF